MVDYRRLYENQFEENRRYRSKLSQAESRHKRLYDGTVQRFRKLHQELKNVQTEAEQRNAQIQSFLSSFLPEFNFSPASNSTPSLDGEGEKQPPNPAKVNNTGNPVPTPKVTYEWKEANYGYSSSYRFAASNYRSAKVDELNVTFRFDVDSRDLPTKIQLEIRDNRGRVCFKKRQNIYYVKLQERIPTLDAEQDYKLQITTVTDGDETVEEVVIHNKRFRERDVLNEKGVQLSDLSLENAIQDFIEEVKYFELGDDDDDEQTQQQQQPREEEVKATVIEDAVDEGSVRAKKSSCVVLRRKSSSSSPVTTHNKLILAKKLVLPRHVRYRWQKGFRKALNGRYVKTPILKIELKFDDDQHILPPHLTLKSDAARVEVKARVAEYECVAEVVVEAENRGGKPPEAEGSHIKWEFSVKDAEEIVPRFNVKVDRLNEETLNEWFTTDVIFTKHNNDDDDQ